ncbi:uncharacterized protein RHOBADRAFT_51581, partial [Rhodotorula graminis WP1]
ARPHSNSLARPSSDPHPAPLVALLLLVLISPPPTLIGNSTRRHGTAPPRPAHLAHPLPARRPGLAGTHRPSPRRPPPPSTSSPRSRRRPRERCTGTRHRPPRRPARVQPGRDRRPRGPQARLGHPRGPHHQARQRRVVVAVRGPRPGTLAPRHQRRGRRDRASRCRPARVVPVVPAPRRPRRPRPVRLDSALERGQAASRGLVRRR